MAESPIAKTGDFQVGDDVRIITDKTALISLQKDYGGWIDSLETAIGKQGVVKGIFQNGAVRVQVSTDAPIFNPKALRKLRSDSLTEDFNVGDIVKLIEDKVSFKKFQNDCSFMDEMLHFLGQTGVVLKVFDNLAVRVEGNGFVWNLHPRCLKSQAGNDKKLEVVQKDSSTSPLLHIPPTEPPKEIKDGTGVKVRSKVFKDVNILKHNYNITGTRQGLIIINGNFINLNNRDAAKLEEENLKNLCDQLCINYDFHSDLTAEEMEIAIDSFVRSFKITKSSLIFIAICSHGGKGDKISGVGDNIPDENGPGDFITLRKIERKFSNVDAFLTKPKLFLIQTCSGGKEKPSEMQADGLPTPHPKRAFVSTSTSDTAIMFNTGEDDYTCNPKNGKIFLQTLNGCVMEDIARHHFNDILTISTGMFSKDFTRKQLTCTFQSTFQHFLRF